VAFLKKRLGVLSKMLRRFGSNIEAFYLNEYRYFSMHFYSLSSEVFIEASSFGNFMVNGLILSKSEVLRL
jgi:hypothetical protein